MPYCNRADLVARFGDQEINDLLDRNNDGSDDNNTLTLTIADAGALIDGYLGSRYAVPLSVAPQAVTAIACDIVRFKLWDDRAPEEIRKRFDDALKSLTNYSKGIMVLVGVSMPENNPSGGIEFHAEGRVFTRDSLAGF
jgi:phage gp36-like protein